MTIRAHAAATHAGRKRRRNEDAYVERPPLFAVADGMGGAQAGEVASRLAAAALEDDADGASGPEERVVALIEEANRRVFQRANEDEAASGMGTTMTVALVDDDRVTIGHVGDSRAYRFREGEIEQLTDDHSLVAELVRSGRLTPEEADTHPQRSVITRAVGTDPDIDVDRFTVKAAPGDVYLICSDGLSDMLDEQQIRDVFAEHPDNLQAAAKALVTAANRVGGDDNITVVCFQIGEEPSSEQTQAMDLPTKENALADEEDTLSGLDGPTAVQVPAHPEEATEPETTRHWRRWAVALLGPAVVVTALVVWQVVR
jgi:PPM family protein phosphatase